MASYHPLNHVHRLYFVPSLLKTLFQLKNLIGHPITHWFTLASATDDLSSSDSHLLGRLRSGTESDGLE